MHNDSSNALFPFGKYKGQPIGTAPLNYLLWIISKEQTFRPRYRTFFGYVCRQVSRTLDSIADDLEPPKPRKPGPFRFISAEDLMKEDFDQD